MDYSKIPKLGGTKWQWGAETMEIQQEGNLLKFVWNNGSKSYGEIYWDGASSKYKVILLRRNYDPIHYSLDETAKSLSVPGDTKNRLL